MSEKKENEPNYFNGNVELSQPTLAHLLSLETEVLNCLLNEINLKEESFKIDELLLFSIINDLKKINGSLIGLRNIKESVKNSQLRKNFDEETCLVFERSELGHKYLSKLDNKI